MSATVYMSFCCQSNPAILQLYLLKLLPFPAPPSVVCKLSEKPSSPQPETLDWAGWCIWNLKGSKNDSWPTCQSVSLPCRSCLLFDRSECCQVGKKSSIFSPRWKALRECINAKTSHQEQPCVSKLSTFQEVKKEEKQNTKTRACFLEIYRAQLRERKRGKVRRACSRRFTYNWERRICFWRYKS